MLSASGWRSGQNLTFGLVRKQEWKNKVKVCLCKERDARAWVHVLPQTPILTDDSVSLMSPVNSEQQIQV